MSRPSRSLQPRSISSMRVGKGVAQPDPEPARLAETAKLLRHRIDPHCRPERAMGSGEHVGAEQPEILVLAVEQIGYAREELQVPGQLPNDPPESWIAPPGYCAPLLV